MPRGGKRQGAPGKAYAARTDLNAPKVLPPTAGPSQQYGSRQAQIEAQKALPMASGPAAPAPPAAGPVDPREAARNFQMPSVTPLDAESQRPLEPVTAGLSVGAGPGLEAIPALAPDTGIGDMAAYLPMLEFMASQPGSSGQLRQLVRRVRGGMTD